MGIEKENEKGKERGNEDEIAKTDDRLLHNLVIMSFIVSLRLSREF
jgi:hypothetical protein